HQSSVPAPNIEVLHVLLGDQKNARNATPPEPHLKEQPRGCRLGSVDCVGALSLCLTKPLTRAARVSYGIGQGRHRRVECSGLVSRCWDALVHGLKLTSKTTALPPRSRA